MPDGALQRYRAQIAYDGTAYGGWQAQLGGGTIQDALEAVLLKISGAKVRVHASGRTDQGVHARGQVIHFDLSGPVPPARLHRSLNALLARDIRIMSLAYAPRDFHARKSATGKEYRYQIWNGAVMPPEKRLYAHHERRALAVEAMQAAAQILVGRHDFASFTANPNRRVESTVRHLRGLDVRKRGRTITIIAEGEGFLYKMVRSLVGHLLRVGLGLVDAAETAEILAARQRTSLVETAPPQGLSLWSVRYD